MADCTVWHESIMPPPASSRESTHFRFTAPLIIPRADEGSTRPVRHVGARVGAQERARQQADLVPRPRLPSAMMTTTVVAVEIRESAHKHGVPDDDIRHAVNNGIGSITRADLPDFTMLIGPDTRSALIEVGIVETEDQDYVIHAMRARDRYLKMIDPRRGDAR